MKISPGSYNEKSRCGYCGAKDSSQMYGFLAYELTPEEYQELIDRGFRRSGTFIYKPDLKNSCCPQYTIRLDVKQFKPGKEHRQGLNRFNRYVTSSSSTRQTGRKNSQFSLLEAIHEAEENSNEGEFKIKLDRAKFTEERYQLFRHYQMHVHNEGEDEIDRKQFKRFLCENPFIGTQQHGTEGFSGAFHQLYYHKEKLIGIGVLDILPNCISSVYFIWHQDYGKFGMGKIASLQEIGLSIELDKPYYYMGYYIHSCPKMKYKGQYRPSYLLEPRFTEADRGNRWRDLQDYEKLLDSQNYVSLINLPIPQHDNVDEESALFESEMPGILPPSELKNLNPHDYLQLIIDSEELDQEIPVGMDMVLPRYKKIIEQTLLELIAILGKDLAKNTRVKLG